MPTPHAPGSRRAPGQAKMEYGLILVAVAVVVIVAVLAFGSRVAALYSGFGPRLP